MKITKEQLKRIIKEEILREAGTIGWNEKNGIFQGMYKSYCFVY